MKETIYLCSHSPRRQELLKLTGLQFEILPLDGLDEEAFMESYVGNNVIGMAEHLAIQKGKAAVALGLNGIFITADTLVIADDGKLLGKPRDRTEAEIFLERLAGNWHTVATGVALSQRAGLSGLRQNSILETTRVKFGQMTRHEIDEYISSGEPFDKAGGYGIQGKASIFVERIEGCYFNVVGFPIYSFWQMWKRYIASEKAL